MPVRVAICTSFWLLCLFGLNLGAQGFGCGDLGLGANGEVEEREVDLDAEADVVGSEVAVISAVTIQLVGVVVVDGSETDLRTAPCEVVAVGFKLL